MLSSLRQRRFRITPQRLAILEILASSDEHPTVGRIYQAVKEKFPTTSLATVYKTVDLLKGIHEVLELGFPDGSNRYDGCNPQPHPHMICVRCKKIMDPELAGLEGLREEMSRKTGYEILYHRLDFFGLCGDCHKA